MTETEKRRIALLQETRKMYSEKNTPPAIHPRYQSAYQSIYKNDEFSRGEKESGSFVVRTVVAILLFCMFLFASKSGMEETKAVMQEMTRDGFVDFQIFR